MRREDLQPFGQMLDAVCSLLSRGNYTPNATNTALFFRALQRYSLDEVRAGFDAHVSDPQRGKFVPTPADVIAQIEGLAANDGRPGAEEAWAIVLRGRDEAETIVWTAEMAEAWSIAKPVMDLGDEVGARMAFRESYGRLVEDARRKRMPPGWSLSLGHDEQRRIEAIRSAVSDGRLPESELQALPAPRGDVPLLAAPKAGAMSQAEATAREALRNLADRLRARREAPSEDYVAKLETEQLKAEAHRKFVEAGAELIGRAETKVQEQQQ